jgi:hypothetical protein
MFTFMHSFYGLALELFIRFSISNNSFVFIKIAHHVSYITLIFVSYSSDANQVSAPTIGIQFTGGSIFQNIVGAYEVVYDRLVSAILLLATFQVSKFAMAVSN